MQHTTEYLWIESAPQNDFMSKLKTEGQKKKVYKFFPRLSVLAAWTDHTLPAAGLRGLFLKIIILWMPRWNTFIVCSKFSSIWVWKNARRVMVYLAPQV